MNGSLEAALNEWQRIFVFWSSSDGGVATVRRGGGFLPGKSGSFSG